MSNYNTWSVLPLPLTVPPSNFSKVRTSGGAKCWETNEEKKNNISLNKKPLNDSH